MDYEKQPVLDVSRHKVINVDIYKRYKNFTKQILAYHIVKVLHILDQSLDPL